MTRGVPEPPPRGVFLDEVFDTTPSGSLGLAAAAVGALSSVFASGARLRRYHPPKYDGAALRAIRATKGVGRPPRAT